KPPGNIVPRNIICKCADVSDVQIRQALDGGGLPELQDALKCGTFCGACLPEIKRMVAESPARVAVTS
ncbi:MAG: (2Fe-2S)-binding protein, partial [Azonexus sp.]